MLGGAGRTVQQTRKQKRRFTMARKFVKTWMMIAFSLSLILQLSGWAVAQTNFDRMVVFGDSLSDSGNAFALLGVANTPPYQYLDQLLIPDRPYAKGGHHFSNGQTWVEDVARAYGLAGNTRPGFAELGTEASNYAVGGARARENQGTSNLPLQVNTFLNVFGGAAPANALYVVEVGGNDIRDALAAQDPSIIEQALVSVQNNLAILYGAGARKFLVCTAPDISLTPAVITIDKMYPGSGAAAKALSYAYNTNLNMILDLMSYLPDVEIVRVSFDQTLVQLVKDPAAFGLSVVDQPCVSPAVAPYSCSKPDEFLFWDGIHPTKAVHSIISQEALKQLAK
jgi:phospholipase/lecithinase/hemolysin